MKRPRQIAIASAVFLATLIVSCQGGNVGEPPLYGQRIHSRTFEDFISTRIYNPSNQGATAGIRETITYEYDDAAHLFWTRATGVDNLGNVISTGVQALDDDGFPVRSMWYAGNGHFRSACDYTYDKSIYLVTSEICYIDDPSSNPAARRDYERSNLWNEDGVLISRTGIEYDASGVKASEYSWRSTGVDNALKGTGGIGYDEYYREYKRGVLIYQETTMFDDDGFPQTYNVDATGDGNYEATYHSEIGKSPEEYLESVIWKEDVTNDMKWKTTFAYDKEGLPKTTNHYHYERITDKFVLDTITTDVWYRNPVNGVSGGTEVYFLSDENGSPLMNSEAIEWTGTQKTHHYYASPGEEVLRITDTLEKIRLTRSP